MPRGRPWPGVVEQLVAAPGASCVLCHACRHRVVGSPLPVPCDDDARTTVTWSCWLRGVCVNRPRPSFSLHVRVLTVTA